MALTIAAIPIMDVRNKNKDLLLTDGISDKDIEDKINEAITDTLELVGETIDDTTINDDNCPNALKSAIILMAASDAICDNYVDSPSAIKIAEMHKLRAKEKIQAIIAGKRRLKGIKKQDSPLSVPFAYICDDTDERIDNYIDKINRY